MLLGIALLLLNVFSVGNAKYVEGHIKTLEDWVFVSRFCFLSEHGRYEYYIEYEKKYGDLQLLLYFDEKHQWPSVYKTPLSCQEKLSVLSAEDNQIVKLSARSPYFHKSGCSIRTSSGKDGSTTTTTTAKPQTQTTRHPEQLDSTYFDQFLKSTTQIPSSTQVPSTSTFLTFSTPIAGSVENFFGNDSDVETGFETHNGSHVYKTNLFDQEVFENNLENNTEYKTDVEEMFEGVNKTRIRRAADPKLFDSDKKGTIIVSCHNAGGFTSSRQRWWYIALANCGSNKGIDVKFKFRMTNGPLGDFWHEHFSADEMFIPPVLLAEVILYTFLLLAILICALELKTRNLYHCTYRLFTMSATLHWSGILLNSVTWAKYAVSGIGPFTAFGGLFTGAGEICFLLLMLLMAKGYTITRARLSTGSTVKITIFINLYIVVFIALYIYQAEAFDPGDVLNLYESTAGYCLAALRFCAWIFFVIACSSTIRKFPEKRDFFYPFGILGSIWLLAGPILIFMLVGLLDPWVRESVVFLAFAIVAFGGHAAFLWLTWPSRANKSFPYHVKTNHIGIIASRDDDGADYPRHTYEPAVPDASIIIPLSRRTEEFVNGGIYNPAFVRDIDHFRSTSNAPLSHVHECLPTPSLRTRLPSPIHGPPTLTNNATTMRLFGQDQLNNDNDNDSIDTTIETESGITKQNSAENRMSSFEGEDNNGGPNSGASRHSSFDNDSGHLSLEITGSPNSNDTPTTPQDESLNNPTEPEKSNSSSPPPLVPILKDNPFKVSTNKVPNKVLLEPIQLPIHNNLNHNSNVPRHLFTIKKTSQ